MTNVGWRPGWAPCRAVAKEGAVVASVTPPSPTRLAPSRSRPRIWHLSLLVLLVAVAIADIQDQRIHEPVLVALAVGGFVLYGVIGWLGWWVARRRLGPRLGTAWLFALYATAMAALFLVATVIYLVIEHVYRAGRF